MARTIKNPVVVTMSKAVGEKLFLALHAAGDFVNDADRLAGIVGDAIEDQTGRSFTMTLCRKDALAMHRIALNEVRIGGEYMPSRSYTAVENAFRKAYDARLKASVGE